MSATAHADARGDHQRPVGAGECLTERGDDTAVLFAILGEPRKIMVERGVDHGFRLGRAVAQALGILEGSPIHLGTGGSQRLGTRVGAGDADDLISGLKKFGNEGRTDETGRAG
ncbi:hypothetical protein X741_28830 [Mesorhizobium sp. LNHC229A00]|nr:hypothetical protein X741_28830 [Mesorhizobium sp. LNHC229A00]